jgi:hypothetical protein
MHAMELWSEVFPHHAGEVEATWKGMEPAWGILREFHARAGSAIDARTQEFWYSFGTVTMEKHRNGFWNRRECFRM